MKMDSKKLGKLKMPGKRDELEMPADEMDASMEEGSPEEEASESPEEAAAEGDDSSAGQELAHLSDDDLLAEIKKRGLMSKLQDKGEQEADDGSDQSMYS